MLNSTRLAAGEFIDSQSKRRYIRVIYQNKDNSIRESCYDSDNGWYTRNDQLIVSGDIAMPKSPIAVTYWGTGQEVCKSVSHTRPSTYVILDSSILSQSR
jgi:hypothetical protein